MGILSRDEQANFIRVFSSLLSSGRSVKDALLLLAEDYRDRGIFPFELPEGLKKYQKGYISETIENVAEEIAQGVRPEEAFLSLTILDEDVRKSLAKAVTGEATKMTDSLADLLEKESDLRGELKKLAFLPAISLLILILVSYVLVFKLAGAVKGIVTKPELLPAGPRLMLFLSDHKEYYYAGVVGVLVFAFLFVKSGVWRKLIPAFRDFERLQFLSWFNILSEVGFTPYETFLFLSETVSKRWREKVEEIIDSLTAGAKPSEVVDELKGLLYPSDLVFLKAGLSSGDVSETLSHLLRILPKQVERRIQVSSQLLNTVMLVVVGLVIIGVYIGVIVPLVTGIQKAMM